MAKVNRLPYTDVIDDLDLGSVIYPKYITSDSILRYVRAMQNTIGSNVETLYHILDSQAEALEFAVHDHSPVTGVPLSELKLKKNLLICCLTIQLACQLRHIDSIVCLNQACHVPYIFQRICRL